MISKSKHLQYFCKLQVFSIQYNIILPRIQYGTQAPSQKALPPYQKPHMRHYHTSVLYNIIIYWVLWIHSHLNSHPIPFSMCQTPKSTRLCLLYYFYVTRPFIIHIHALAPSFLLCSYILTLIVIPPHPSGKFALWLLSPICRLIHSHLWQARSNTFSWLQLCLLRIHSRFVSLFSYTRSNHIPYFATYILVAI